jgi:hypothetical protein
MVTSVIRTSSRRLSWNSSSRRTHVNDDDIESETESDDFFEEVNPMLSAIVAVQADIMELDLSEEFLL